MSEVTLYYDKGSGHELNPENPLQKVFLADKNCYTNASMLLVKSNWVVNFVDGNALEKAFSD